MNKEAKLYLEGILNEVEVVHIVDDNEDEGDYFAKVSDDYSQIIVNDRLFSTLDEEEQTYVMFHEYVHISLKSGDHDSEFYDELCDWIKRLEFNRETCIKIEDICPVWYMWIPFRKMEVKG